MKDNHYQVHTNIHSKACSWWKKDLSVQHRHTLHYLGQGEKQKQQKTTTYNLFLCVFVGAEQINGLHVAKVDVMTQQENKEQFAHILLLLVAI
jgi:hypothetical protein